MSALRLTYPVAKEDGLHVEIPPLVGLIRVENASRADWLSIREEVTALSLVEAGVSDNWQVYKAVLTTSWFAG